nr:GTP cyclohydrolase IIa [Desulfurococcales archaeon]
ACDESPLAAESRAWSLLARLGPGEVSYSECGGSEIVAIAHVDIDDIMEETRKNGAVRTYNKVIDLLHKLASTVEEWGGLAQYLGGDNVLVVLPSTGYVEASSRLLSVRPGLKAGIGVSRKAREALQLAADALHEIRSGGGKRIVYRIQAGSRLGRKR